MDALVQRIWQELDLVRVYTKKKSMFPEFTEPLIITPQRGAATVENAVCMLHKSLLEDFKAAYIWGSSVKLSPSICGLKHKLMDEDVMQIIKMTQAEKSKKQHGKKTGTTLAGGNTAVDPKKAKERGALKS